jgi:hypothetical protein
MEGNLLLTWTNNFHRVAFSLFALLKNPTHTPTTTRPQDTPQKSGGSGEKGFELNANPCAGRLGRIARSAFPCCHCFTGGLLLHRRVGEHATAKSQEPAGKGPRI